MDSLLEAAGIPLDASFSACVKCGKKIKRKYYHKGQGPYGEYCYKKLFGDVVVKRIGRGIQFRKHKAMKQLCPEGLAEDCGECMLRSICKHKRK